MRMMRIMILGKTMTLTMRINLSLTKSVRPGCQFIKIVQVALLSTEAMPCQFFNGRPLHPEDRSLFGLNCGNVDERFWKSVLRRRAWKSRIVRDLWLFF